MIRRSWLLSAVLLALVVPVTVPALAAGESLESLQWGLGQIRVAGAWTVTRGAGATVAIIDSGVDLGHPEFAGRIAGGATFIGCASARDGCGDGDLRSADDPEPSGHGTHVAGIVAAADDGVGVTGVAPDARLLVVKALGGDGKGNTTGTTADIAAGIRWAVRNGADVINLSLSEQPGSQPLHITGLTRDLGEAVADAAAAGVVVVAAAGNDFGIPACNEPAFDPQVMCVIATDRQETRAVYSNYGVDQGLNVVAAPGGAALLRCEDDVLSTFPRGTADPLCPTIPAGYGYLAGTSMAAPHVAGVAALLRASGRSAQDTVDLLRSTARNPATGLRGRYDPNYGYGIVDATAAVGLAEAATVSVTRHAGADRIATAVAVSVASYPEGADVVVLARSDAYADALAGAPLATLHGAPLLLTARDRLSAATADEIDRLGAQTAYLLGGEAALSARVAADLSQRGVTVVRFDGANRYATAARIAQALPSRARVYVVEGANVDPARGWPDALSASGLAAAFTEPILLVQRDRLPTETAQVIQPGTEVVIVGGAASVSADVESRLRDLGADVRRLQGADRYATSVEVASEALQRGASADDLWIATGRSFPDGLAAGAAAGSVGGVFLLVDGTDLDRSAASRDFLAALGGQVERAMLAGGRAAITTATEDRIRTLLG